MYLPCSAIDSTNGLDTARLAGGEQPVDEATLIEERRKRREAIKAKHRGQATPVLVQALALENKPDFNTPKPFLSEAAPQVEGGDRRKPLFKDFANSNTQLLRTDHLLIPPKIRRVKILLPIS